MSDPAPVVPETQPQFLNGIAERVGGAARAELVFGEAITRDGVTVIPVARVTWGFGGGVSQGKPGEAAGGGGGLIAAPTGYIEIAGGRSRFRPIYEPAAVLAAAGLAAGGLALLAARLLRRRT